MTEEISRRNTRQRQVVLEELRKLTSHPTASELYEIARRRLPSISLGTVYRNLEFLSKTGVINKLQISGSEARFDGDAGNHRHIRCVHCGHIEDIHGLSPALVSTEVENLTSFKMLGHRLEFFGICPDCDKKSNGEKGGTSA